MKKNILIFIINLLIIISPKYSFAEDVQINTSTVTGANGGIITINYAIVPGSGAGNLLIDTSLLSLESSGSINSNTTCSASAFSMNNFESFQITDIENVNNTGGPVCDYFIDFTLTNSITDGDYIIANSLYDTVNNTSTSLENTVVTVVNANKVTAAETLDSNSNGFIDTLKLIFERGGLNENTFNNIGLRIGSLTNISLGSVIDNIVLLTFNEDSNPNTGFIPQLEHTGSIFDGINPFNSMNPEYGVDVIDKAKPIVYKINGQDPDGSISISENSKLSIEFSENMYIPSIIKSFQIIENSTPITNTGYIVGENNTLTYCKGGYDSNGDCNIFFDTNATYTIKVGSGMIDLNSNQYTGGDLEIDISVQDITPPVPLNITYNGENNNGIIINGNSGNNSYTNNSVGNVNLTISASDNSGLISEMCISEDNTLTNDNICDTSWKSYSTNSTLNFSGGEGIKSLYIKFKDASGNISSVSNDSITWDKVEPSTTSNPSGGYYQNGNSLNVNLICSDNTTSCATTYYSIDGTTPSVSLNSGDTINITGTDQVITLKYFSIDSAGNQEGTTNIEKFNFSNSYVNFNNNLTVTTNIVLSLSGTCNESGGEINMEYTLDNWSNTISTTCDTNIWTGSLNLSTNSVNLIQARYQTNTGITSSYTIVHDNISPDNLNLLINNGDTYSNSRNVNLLISATDINGINQMMLSESDTFTGAIWENYSNSKSLEVSDNDGVKTIYIKVKDEAGNISTTSNDSIILETTIPTLSSDLPTGSYSSSRTVVLNSSDNIYYTLDNSTPSNSSTLYSTGITLGNTEGLVNFKAISYGISGLTSSIISNIYDFKCNLVSHGTVTNYPTCILVCDSGYTNNGTTCTASASSGGGGGGGGGGAMVDYESEKQISPVKFKLFETIKKLVSKYGILDLNKIDSSILTDSNGILKLRIGVKAYSSLIIGNGTNIISKAKEIYAPYSIDTIAKLRLKEVNINSNNFRAYNVEKIFFAGNKENNVRFNKEIGIKLNLGKKITEELYVFNSDNTDGNFGLISKGLFTDNKGIIEFKSDSLGYFLIITESNIKKYLPNFSGENTNNETIKDITEVEKSEEVEIKLLKEKISNHSLDSMIEKFHKNISIKDIDYYLEFDQSLNNEYNIVKKGYNDFFINIDKYLTTKDLKYRKLAGKGYINYLKYKKLNNFKYRYVSVSNRNGKIFYRSNYQPISKIVISLENKLIKKLNLLLENKNINNETYISTIENYNEFILNLTIFKQYNFKQAALKALTPGKKFLKVYKMKVVENIEIISIIKIKDKYTFSKELKFGDYNQDVKNLQEIMKKYGYFNYPQTTYYFGNVTKESLISFSKNILHTENSEGIFSNQIINKIYEIEFIN